MRIRLLFISIVLVLAATPVIAQIDGEAGTGVLPPPVQWQGFDTALEQARSEDKHIMVTVYTDVCGYCKKLDRVTFTDPAVREVLDDAYVSAKVKADSGKRLKVQSQIVDDGSRQLLQYHTVDDPTLSGSDLRSQWMLRGVPGIIFLNPEGRVITIVNGYKSPADMHNMLTFVKDDLYEVMTWQDYLKSLERAKDQNRDKS